MEAAWEKCNGPPQSIRGHARLKDLVGGRDASLPPPPPSPRQDATELDLAPAPPPGAITMASPGHENSQATPAPESTGDDSSEKVVPTNGPEATRANGVVSDIQHWQGELPREKKGNNLLEVRGQRGLAYRPWFCRGHQGCLCLTPLDGTQRSTDQVIHLGPRRNLWAGPGLPA